MVSLKDEMDAMEAVVEAARKLMYRADLAPVTHSAALREKIRDYDDLKERQRQENDVPLSAPSGRIPGYMGDVAGLGCDPDVAG